MTNFSRWNHGNGFDGKGNPEPDWRPTSNSDTIELGEGGSPIGFGIPALTYYLKGPHGNRTDGPNAQDVAEGWVFGEMQEKWPNSQPQWVDHDWGVPPGYGVIGGFSGSVQRWPIWYHWIRGSVATPVAPPVVQIPPPDPTPVLSSSDPTWGQVIPESFGTRRITGAPIWVSAVRRVAEHGFTGAVDFAVAFGTTARPASDARLVNLTKLFADGKLVYDATGTSPVAQSGISVTFHPGLPDAQPDPTIKAVVGAVTPAFRDMFYVVIRNYPLFHSDTKLPSIRGELVDAPAFDIPTTTPVDQLSPPRNIVGSALITDFDTETVYGFSSIDAEPHFLHSFDLTTGTELSQVEINGDVVNLTPGVPPGSFTYVAVDWWTVYDKYNDFAHFQHGPSITNAMRIGTMRLDSGVLVASYGTNSNATVSDTATLGFSDYADFFRFRAFGKTIHGLLVGTIFNEAVVLSYRTVDTQPADASNQVKLSYAGVLKAGDEFRLAFEHKETTADEVVGVCAYPVLDRPELDSQFNVNSSDAQDAVLLYGTGTQLMCFQGNISGNSPSDAETASWVTTVAAHAIYDFDDGKKVGAVFVDNNSGCIFVLGNDGTSTSTLVKLAPTFAKNGNSAVLVSVTKLWETPIITDNRLFGNMIKNENMAGGMLAYFGEASNIVVLSLDTGSEVYRHTTTYTLPDIGAYDSTTQTIFATDAGVPVRVGLFGATSSLVPVTDFLKWCSLRLGYGLGDITGDVGITDLLIGGNIKTPTTARQALVTVAAMYGVAAVEVGGLMKFVRPEPGNAATLAAVFTRDDISRMSESELEAVTTTTMAANELIANVSVGYLDPANDYDDTTQTYKRVRFPFQTSKHAGTTNYNAPIVVAAGDALSIAARLVLTSYAEGTAFEYRLPHRYLNLSPGDVVGFLENDNLTLNVLSQILQITYNADWSMTLRGKRWSLSDTMTLTADAPAGRQIITAQLPSDSVAHALDVPLILPEDETPGASLIYTGVGTLGQTWWKSATLNRTLDGILSELYFTTSTIPWGIAANALPQSELLNNTFATDNDTVLTVSGRALTSNMLTSVSADDFRAGMNACFVGQPGTWELVYFRDVEVVSPNTFRLTGLLRGRRGTNVYCDRHAAGDTVVFVRSNGARASFRGDRLDPGSRGKLLTYYAVGENTRRSPTPNQFTFTGNSQKPWSVRRIVAAPASTVNAVNATSYSNECGSGDRRDLVGITSLFHTVDVFSADAGEVPLVPNVDYALSNLIDGDDGNNEHHATKFFSGQTAVTIVFSFKPSGFKQIIDEFTWTQSNGTSVGTYDVDASDDGVTWTNLAGGVDLAGSGGVHGFTNTTGYWFYRFNQTGGATSDSPWLKEVTFKTKAQIEDANDILITWLRRDRLSPAAIFVTDTQPMTESAELYQVEVFPFAATLTGTWPKVLDLVSSPRVLYTAALQASHGFTSPVAFLGLRISQLGQGTDTANRVGLNNAQPTGIQVGATP